MRQQPSKISKENLIELSRQWSGSSFRSEAEARQKLTETEEYLERQYGGLVGKKRTKSQIAAYVASVPVYKTGKLFKIGERPSKKKFSWDSVRIIPTTMSELEGLVWPEEDRLSKVKMVPVDSITRTETHSETSAGKKKVSEIAEELTTSDDPYFKTLTIEEDGALADGHHRLEALKYIGVKDAPVRVVYRGSDGR